MSAYARAVSSSSGELDVHHSDTVVDWLTRRRTPVWPELSETRSGKAAKRTGCWQSPSLWTDPKQDISLSQSYITFDSWEPLDFLADIHSLWSFETPSHRWTGNETIDEWSIAKRRPACLILTRNRRFTCDILTASSRRLSECTKSLPHESSRRIPSALDRLIDRRTCVGLQALATTSP
jgi:hypothetical protein